VDSEAIEVQGEASPPLILANRKRRLLGKRAPKGTPYRHIKNHSLALKLGNFVRSWQHPTKGARKQVISKREAAVLLMSGAYQLA
jgi:hypothetical protein